MPVYRIYLRSELASGYAYIAEVETLPFNTTDLVMRNDMDGRKFVQDGSEEPLDSPKFSQLEVTHA